MNHAIGPSHLQVAVDGNGELRDTRAIERSPDGLAPPLRCADCGAFVEAVRSYPRRDGVAIVQVAAHYRLAPGATHARGCPWSEKPGPPGPQSSRPVARRTPAPLVYSLVVPDRKQRPRGAWRRRSYRPCGRPALNSAATVADILRRQSEVATIRLDYRGRAIQWKDFLINASEGPRLMRILESDTPRHPIAVTGVIAAVAVTSSARIHSAFLLGTIDPPVEGTMRAKIVILTPHKGLLEVVDHGHAVAFGWWRLQRPSADIPYATAVLWIGRRWQISPLPDPSS
jgi:hypothetical protein